MFSIGDVVHLKSGSPKMTVTAVNDPWVSVVWIDFHKGDSKELSLHENCFLPYTRGPWRNRKKPDISYDSGDTDEIPF